MKALQIKSKIPRRKALSALEDKVLSILTEKGYVSKDQVSGAAEGLVDICDDEDEDEEVIIDGEVDEGDVHIKPVARKPVPLVRPVKILLLSSLILAFLVHLVPIDGTLFNVVSFTCCARAI